MDTIQSAITGSDWSQRYGAMCPACGVFTRTSYKHAPWNDGMKTRYHVCPNPDCRCRFQSLAVDIRLDEPDDDQLRFLRVYGDRAFA